METAKDLSRTLPEGMRKTFEEHYARQDPVAWGSTDGSCGRCGCTVPASSRGLHEVWHKNVSCQMWMLGTWPGDHLRDHVKETAAFQAVIASIIGFIDPEGGPPTEGGHTHEDGTTHVH